MSLVRYICPLCYEDGFTKKSLRAHGCRGVFGNRWTRKLSRWELAGAKSYRVPAKNSGRPVT